MVVAVKASSKLLIPVFLLAATTAMIMPALARCYRQRFYVGHNRLWEGLSPFGVIASPVLSDLRQNTLLYANRHHGKFPPTVDVLMHAPSLRSLDPKMRQEMINAVRYEGVLTHSKSSTKSWKLYIENPNCPGQGAMIDSGGKIMYYIQ